MEEIQVRDDSYSGQSLQVMRSGQILDAFCRESRYSLLMGQREGKNLNFSDQCEEERNKQQR